MRYQIRRSRLVPLLGVAVAAFAVLSSGCMTYPEGTVGTPVAPGQSDGSRLPQLLSQLQGAGAGIELLDGSQSEVLAAQDAQGKEASTATATVAGEKTPGTTTTPAGTPTRAGTPTKTPTPTRTPTQAPESGTTPTPTSTPTPTATPTSATTQAPTATPTPTVNPNPPSEGGSPTPAGNPPTE